jgi:hypothetical protein
MINYEALTEAQRKLLNKKLDSKRIKPRRVASQVSRNYFDTEIPPRATEGEVFERERIERLDIKRLKNLKSGHRV